MDSEDIYKGIVFFFPKRKVLAVRLLIIKGMQETPKGFPGPGALHFVDIS